ncbi:glutathione S-transferase 1-like [Cylas formicarius]|uniref:glutathione S-transferase 1-like n=1 Tax=Cylas formicarius TaxID=197179 RepID=UPI0029585387|nr:glutathione S-transferase 1-like [Cylas formicarius]
MPIVLYGTITSPPVRAVLMTAEALGLKLEFREVNLVKLEHLKPEYLKINPQHTIPTLDDDGVILWDSHAIVAYLVGKYAKDDSLYPKDLAKRGLIDSRLHFDTGYAFAALREPVASSFWNILFKYLRTTINVSNNRHLN